MRSLIFLFLFCSRCKSETDREWDKEIDLRDYGFLLQLKYDEPLNPLKGGKAHLKLQNKYAHHLEPQDLDVDLGFSEGEYVGDGLFTGQIRYTYINRNYTATGSFDVETKVEGGIWKLLAGVPPLSMPLIQLEAGVNYPEKTTKIRAIVKGGPSLDLDLTAIFNSSGFVDSASFEIVCNGAKNSLLLSRDTSSISKWILQLTRPSEDVGEPNPTFNFNIELQDNGGHVSDLKIFGELKDLDLGLPWMDIDLNPWALIGYHPRDIEGGPWRMLIELTTKKTSSATSMSEFVAKFSNSLEKEITLLEFQCTKSMLENSTTLPSSEEPFVLDIAYTLGDGKQQHFNKVHILMDIFKAWAKNLEISLQNENRPENEEFSYKLQYEKKSYPEVRGGQWSLVDNINYISLMESGCTGSPNRTIERLSGNYTWTDLQNPEKFEFRSEDNFYSEARLLETPGLGLPFAWLGRLYAETFWTSYEFENTISLLKFESGFPLYQLARMLGVEGNEPNLGQPKIQLRVSRELVYEKNTVDRFLNFFGRSLEGSGKLTKLEQTVMLHGSMCHHLDYQVTSEHQRSLILESAPQQTWFGERPTKHGIPGSKIMLYYELTYGSGDSLETILASAGGFVFSYMDTQTYNTPRKAGNVTTWTTREKVKHALDVVVDFLEYPKSRGLKCSLDWKVDLISKGIIPVFKYDADFVWITDEKVLEKVFALETREMITQTEESPFYGLLGDLGLIAVYETETNISRLFRWDKTYKTGRVTENGEEVMKIWNKSSDLKPNHFSFDINFRLSRRSTRMIQVELHIPVNNFHNSLLEMNINIGSIFTPENELGTKTKVKFEWEGLGQTGMHFPLKYNITNEILFDGTKGRSEKQKICVDGEGEIGLGLDERGHWDSGTGMYWFVWTGSCRGNSEDSCAYFGIPEIRNLTLAFNTTPWWRYQDFMFHILGRFRNETDLTGLEVDIDKVRIFGFDTGILFIF